jgi:hypothetical protein
MEGWRFDAMTRFLKNKRTRRTALGQTLVGLLALAGLAGTGWMQEGEAVNRRRKRRRRRRRRNRCRGGTTRCGSSCVDLETDPDNCGRCGRECDADEQCRSGVCGCDVCKDDASCPFQTVQEAIDAATEGDTITICKGSFDGVIDLRKSLTLIGAGAGDTKLKGKGEGTVDSVVTVPPNVTVAIRGVTISGGSGTLFGDGAFRGGGILNQGILTLIDSAVVDSRANFGGGIFNAEQARLTLSGTAVARNKAGRFADVGSLGGGIHNRPSGRVTIANGSAISKNEADNGGGIYNIGQLTISDSAISDNESDFDGGGLTNDGGEVTLSNAVVEDNTSSEQGGGIFVVEGAVHLENGTTIRGNKAATSGGGIATNATVTCSQTTILENEAGTLGGGIFLGRNQFSPASLTLEGTVVSENKAGDDGGGILNSAGGAIDLDAQSRVVANDPNNCVGTNACQP